ncbi:FAD-dependent tricarballylate dehydrogenase TcuA [Oxyplasma meridianum]|uniref:FAD-dependent tricarballylate dehydrogenase TcuA n=1 Tax=Oxyplasma meridianum TaxID=3073602 RepID=A0AAX4NEP0_9ARCH
MFNFDVCVIGGGNAGIVSAITAAENGSSVILLEVSPIFERGGNTKYTRDIRYVHEADSYTSGSYSAQELIDDLKSVSGDKINLEKANIVIENSSDIPSWMEKHGVIFKNDIRGTLSLSRTNVFFLGGGKALLNTYYRRAEKLGIKILYNSNLTNIKFNDGTAKSISALIDNNIIQVFFNNLILASGGFEGNTEVLNKLWGPKADNFIIRGSRFNTGKPLFIMRENGAKIIGPPRGGHMVGVDGRAPKFDGGIVTRIDAIPMGIVINRDGERFYDEGEDIWPKRYAIWGQLIADQPDQCAYVIVDAKMKGDYMPGPFPPYSANTFEELFKKLNVPFEKAIKNVEDFNNAVRMGKFDRSVKDDCHTEGISPPKSHWARRIDTPPFYAYPLKPGLTFTYLGLEIDNDGRVMGIDGDFANVYAAGEIMSGNVLVSGYLAGFGLTIGTVFGRRAGNSATGRY